MYGNIGMGMSKDSLFLIPQYNTYDACDHTSKDVNSTQYSVYSLSNKPPLQPHHFLIIDTVLYVISNFLYLSKMDDNTEYVALSFLVISLLDSASLPVVTSSVIVKVKA